jgi:hypothetical protein
MYKNYIPNRPTSPSLKVDNNSILLEFIFHDLDHSDIETNSISIDIEEMLKGEVNCSFLTHTHTFITLKRGEREIREFFENDQNECFVCDVNMHILIFNLFLSSSSSSSSSSDEIIIKAL